MHFSLTRLTPHAGIVTLAADGEGLLLGASGPGTVFVREAGWYADHDVDLRTGVGVGAIDGMLQPADSSLVTPARCPASTSACRTHFRSVSADPIPASSRLTRSPPTRWRSHRMLQHQTHGPLP